MIVFQVTGQSHRLSTPKGKEKDEIKKISTYSTKYTEDTKVLGRQLSQARSKPDPAQPDQQSCYRTSIPKVSNRQATWMVT